MDLVLSRLFELAENYYGTPLNTCFTVSEYVTLTALISSTHKVNLITVDLVYGISVKLLTLARNFSRLKMF